MSKTLEKAQAPAAIGRNLLDNPGFQIRRRGETLTEADNKRGHSRPYLADRWYLNLSGVTKWSYSYNEHDWGDGSYWPYIHYTASTSGQDNFGVGQYLEHAALYQGKTLTLSYWIKSDRAYDNGVQIELNREGSPSDKHIIYTTLNDSPDFIPADTWAKRTATFTVPKGLVQDDNDGKDWVLSILILDKSTTVSGSRIRLAKPKLEEGSQATAWELPDEARELLQASRFYKIVRAFSGYKYSGQSSIREGVSAEFTPSIRTENYLVDRSGLTFIGCSFGDESPGSVTYYQLRVTNTANSYRVYGSVLIDAEIYL